MLRRLQYACCLQTRDELGPAGSREVIPFVNLIGVDADANEEHHLPGKPIECPSSGDDDDSDCGQNLCAAKPGVSRKVGRTIVMEDVG